MKCPECDGKSLIPDGPNRMVSCPLCCGRKTVEIEEAIVALFKFNKRMVVWYEKLVREQERIGRFIDNVRSATMRRKEKKDDEEERGAGEGEGG